MATSTDTNKNNWSELFSDLGGNILVIKNSSNSAEIFRLDFILAIILGIIFPLLAIIFLILVSTDNWFFEVAKKPTNTSS